MAVLQSTYATSIPAGYAGMIAVGESEESIISRTLESSAGVAFGQPAFQGSNAGGCLIGATFAGTAVGAAGVPAPAGATITASPAVAAGAKSGVYSLVCITAGATGKWRIEDPDGVYVGVATTGTEFVGGGLTFTVTDSGTDPAVGEAFIITVTLTADADFLGLVKKDTTLPPNSTSPDSLPQYWNVPIMVTGVMWVTAGATVVAGGAVYWNPSTSRFTSTTTHIPIPRARFDSGGANGELVRVAIRH